MDELDLQVLSAWTENMYDFVKVIMDHMKRPQDYGTGVILNMVEMHTLALIVDHPGISVGEVAKRWSRTISAASRNVDRLQAKGYVEKKKLDGNSKTIHLYATPAGLELADKHKEFDNRELTLFSQYIMQRCTKDDLQHFVCVMNDIKEFYEDQLISHATAQSWQSL